MTRHFDKFRRCDISMFRCQVCADCSRLETYTMAILRSLFARIFSLFGRWTFLPIDTVVRQVSQITGILSSTCRCFDVVPKVWSNLDTSVSRHAADDGSSMLRQIFRWFDLPPFCCFDDFNSWMLPIVRSIFRYFMFSHPDVMYQALVLVCEGAVGQGGQNHGALW